MFFIINILLIMFMIPDEAKSPDPAVEVVALFVVAAVVKMAAVVVPVVVALVVVIAGFVVYLVAVQKVESCFHHGTVVVNRWFTHCHWFPQGLKLVDPVVDVHEVVD